MLNHGSRGGRTHESMACFSSPNHDQETDQHYWCIGSSVEHNQCPTKLGSQLQSTVSAALLGVADSFTNVAENCSGSPGITGKNKEGVCTVPRCRQRICKDRRIGFFLSLQLLKLE